MSGANFHDDGPSSDNAGLEPPTWIVATVVPEALPEEPRAPAKARRPLLMMPIVLFFLTCLSTYSVGWFLYQQAAWLYAVPLMTILACHEAGHFFQARRYHVPASLPFFIPMPIPPIGTMGAVIGMSSTIPNRKALYDIGISGPLAGLVPTMICIVVGLNLSHVGPFLPGRPDVIEFGEPLLFKILARLTFGPIPEGHTVYLHPLGIAGWVGLLITSLNLFPIGQLDGGHVLYALLRTKAHRIATLLLLAAIVCVLVFGYRWWILMLVLLLVMGPKHPPTGNDDVPLGTWRVVLGWLTLAFLPLGFTPNPFAL